MEISDKLMVEKVKKLLRVEPVDEQGLVISADANYPQEYIGMGIGSDDDAGVWSAFAVVYTDTGKKVDRKIAESMLHAYINHKYLISVIHRLLGGNCYSPLPAQIEARQVIEADKRAED